MIKGHCSGEDPVWVGVRVRRGVFNILDLGIELSDGAGLRKGAARPTMPKCYKRLSGSHGQFPGPCDDYICIDVLQSLGEMFRDRFIDVDFRT